MVCDIVLEYAVDYIGSTVKKLRYQCRKNGCSTRGLENDYAMGFIAGLYKKFEEQKKTHQKWALVLCKDKEVTEAYEKIKFTKTISTGTQYSGFLEAYCTGYKDGTKFSISNKIAEDDTEGVLTLVSGAKA